MLIKFFSTPLIYPPWLTDHYESLSYHTRCLQLIKLRPQINRINQTSRLNHIVCNLRFLDQFCTDLRLFSFLFICSLFLNTCMELMDTRNITLRMYSLFLLSLTEWHSRWPHSAFSYTLQFYLWTLLCLQYICSTYQLFYSGFTSDKKYFTNNLGDKSPTQLS